MTAEVLEGRMHPVDGGSVQASRAVLLTFMSGVMLGAAGHTAYLFGVWFGSLLGGA